MKVLLLIVYLAFGKDEPQAYFKYVDSVGQCVEEGRSKAVELELSGNEILVGNCYIRGLKA